MHHKIMQLKNVFGLHKKTVLTDKDSIYDDLIFITKSRKVAVFDVFVLRLRDFASNDLKISCTLKKYPSFPHEMNFDKVNLFVWLVRLK